MTRTRDPLLDEPALGHHARVSDPRTPHGAPLAGAALRMAVIEGRDAGRSAQLPAGGARIRVGAARACDLELHDELVSPSHLECWLAADGVGLRDLGSTTGTFVGPVRVVEAVVPAGARVRVGRSVLAVGAAAPDGDLRARLAAEGLVYASAAMADLAASVQKIAPFSMSVLVEGETGTGKEVVARALHALSMRANGPFVIVDCGALPASLIESELFGHERGAFTGADGRRPGAFELAHGGTLLLDEIGELPRESQAALLGVLQRRHFRRVGGGREVAVDVRVIAATNRDLRAEIDRGSFRADLFYRLATSHLVIPPLRERPEDVPALIARFLAELTGSDAAPPFAGTELRALSSLPWRGNVRELRAVLERAVATGRIDPEPGARHAPPASATRPAAAGADAASAQGGSATDTYRDARARSLEAFERDYLGRLIGACGGNASEAARVARMDRPHMLRLLRRHGLR